MGQFSCRQMGKARCRLAELTTGELIPGQAPLLNCRKEITWEEAIKLWAEKRKAGWQVCLPQWTPPTALQPR